MMNAQTTPPRTNGTTPQQPAPFTPAVTRGVRREPPRIVIHGGPGIGKSSLAACAPDPLFLDLEHGTLQLDVARVDNLNAWDGLLSTVRALVADPTLGGANPGGFKTVVVDTLDRAEWLCWQHLCRKEHVDSIEKLGRGFGKGYTASYEEFRGLARGLDALRAKHGMTVILIAHSRIENAPNPSGDEHQRWTLKVHKQVAGLFYESFDAILYARLETFTSKSESGKVKGIGDRRVLETQESPAWLAKNRYRLPAQINLSWEELAAGLARGAEELAASLLAEINDALTRLTTLDDDAARAARSACAGVTDPQKLSILLNKITAGCAAREAARAPDSTPNT